MTFATSLGLLRVQRSPLESTTRTVLAPSDLMSANALVRVVNQVCGWLTPRITKSLPLASRMRPPLTRMPTAAEADGVKTTKEPAKATEAAIAVLSLTFMTYPG